MRNYYYYGGAIILKNSFTFKIHAITIFQLRLYYFDKLWAEFIFDSETVCNRGGLEIFAIKTLSKTQWNIFETVSVVSDSHCHLRVKTKRIFLHRIHPARLYQTRHVSRLTSCTAKKRQWAWRHAPREIHPYLHKVETSLISLDERKYRNGIRPRTPGSNVDSPNGSRLIHAICRRLSVVFLLPPAKCLFQLFVESRRALNAGHPFRLSFQNQPLEPLAQLSRSHSFCEISTCRAGNRKQSRRA